MSTPDITVQLKAKVQEFLAANPDKKLDETHTLFFRALAEIEGLRTELVEMEDQYV